MIGLPKINKLAVAIHQNMISLPAVPAGVDARFDRSGRQEAVEQNGNTGEHYPGQSDAPALARGCADR